MIALHKASSPAPGRGADTGAFVVREPGKENLCCYAALNNDVTDVNGISTVHSLHRFIVIDKTPKLHDEHVWFYIKYDPFTSKASDQLDLSMSGTVKKNRFVFDIEPIDTMEKLEPHAKLFSDGRRCKIYLHAKS
ncbi:hypothetical protein EVAR_75454_1 [Eumeta japonica]|uniref:Uncharacterized protein n=1 Tax=Eumeta variegata TaxID=151549 RepID=A0A4C1TK21_EUMVA|nr:hypothetical protein EVAR_75454_1 [Eumeta japonica]